MTLNYTLANEKTLKSHCPNLKRSDHDDAVIFEDESVFAKTRLPKMKLVEIKSLEKWQ